MGIVLSVFRQIKGKFMSVEKLEIGGSLVIETQKWENVKPEVSIDYVNNGCFDCSDQDVYVSIDKEKAIEIIEFLKKSFDIT